jgi:UDP-2,3-diacylglucosamine hydrolase
MSHNSDIYIKNDAIFIADSHYNIDKNNLEIFLQKLKNKQIATTQLFLVGDIFDFLNFYNDYFKNINKNMIDLLNELSKDIQIIYLEGNHDFDLEDIFPDILIIPREKQPLVCFKEDKSIAISHGDIFVSWVYDIFCFIFRGKITQRFLNFVDFDNFISKKANNWLLNKKICNNCKDFETFAKKRVNLYKNSYDLIIEGHFHYGGKTKTYVNIPSLACDNSYLILNEKLDIITI